MPLLRNLRSVNRAKRFSATLPAHAKRFMPPRVGASLRATDGWFSSQVGVCNWRSKAYHPSLMTHAKESDGWQAIPR
jgi:hypothetical protein